MDIEEYIHHILENNDNNEDDKELLKEINNSITILNDCIKNYGIDCISLSFNGGKDACIILQLYRYILYKSNISFKDIRILYFSTPNEFKEIEEFMIKIKTLYELNYTKYDCPMKDGMTLEVKRGIKCVIIGTRVGDPYTDEDTPYIQPSSNDWPKFIRINPIIKWSYKQVWSFLKGCNLPYCILYDEGYTSLGNNLNTVKNEALKQIDDNGNTYYLPAYLLQDEKLERNTRI